MKTMMKRSLRAPRCGWICAVLFFIVLPQMSILSPLRIMVNWGSCDNCTSMVSTYMGRVGRVIKGGILHVPTLLSNWEVPVLCPSSLPPSLPGSLSLLLEPDSQPLLSIKAQLKHDFPPLSSLPWFLQLDMLTPSWAFFFVSCIFPCSDYFISFLLISIL